MRSNFWFILSRPFPDTCCMSSNFRMTTKMFGNFGFKDVRANCFCASLLRTAARANSHATSCIERAPSAKMNNDRAFGHCCSFAWI